MRRDELEHIIRAAKGVTQQTEFVIIGSQAILGKFPHANADLLVSMEADVFPLRQPQLAEQIDGAIGERSMFHLTHGYYAHGVAENTATLPNGWRTRLIAISNENTNGATGLCLEPHDLAASKLAAGREKDLGFVEILLREKMIDYKELAKCIDTLPLPAQQIEAIQARLQRINSADRNAT